LWDEVSSACIAWPEREFVTGNEIPCIAWR
jgi:hypothetical protein